MKKQKKAYKMISPVVFFSIMYSNMIFYLKINLDQLQSSSCVTKINLNSDGLIVYHESM